MGLFEKVMPLLLVLIMLVSGCVETGGAVKDIITTGSYYVQDLKPLAGTTTVMEFEVSKKSSGTGDVIVDFFDTSGMLPTSLKCQQPSEIYGTRCVLKNMVYSDVRLVTLTLQAPPRQLIKSETQYKVSYYIQHDYVSKRTAMITVWDGMSITKPKTTFSTSNPSDGPIVIEFGQPSSGTAKGSDVPYRKDVPFEMKVTASNVGSGSIFPQVLAPGKLSVDKGSLFVALAEGEKLHCDFDDFGSSLVSKKTATLPATFTCYLAAQDYFEGYKTYTVSAYLPYTYQYKNSETFTVRPAD